MSLRIRKNNNLIVCAAKSKKLPGDRYLDDNAHYTLGVELLVLSVKGILKNGAEVWEFHAPLKDLDEKIAKEELAMLNIMEGE